MGFAQGSQNLNLPTSMTSRGKDLYFAKLAEQAERYDEMTEHMKAVCNHDEELSEEERNLFSVAYKNSLGSRRAAWRKIVKAEHTTPTSNEEAARYAKQCRIKIESELQEICRTVFELLDSSLFPMATTSESKVFYLKMKADYCRYMAEFSQGETQSEATQNAALAYEDAEKLAARDLAATHPFRLALALNHSVFVFEVLKDAEKAYTMARAAFEDAAAEFSSVDENYRDAAVIMQLLHDHLTCWFSDNVKCDEKSPN